MNQVPAWDALMLKLALVCALACLVPAPMPWPAGGVNASEDPLAELPADLRGKVNTFIEKLGVAKRVMFDKQMKDATDAVVKATGVSGDVLLKNLAAAARDAEERSLVEYAGAVKKTIQKEYQQSPADLLAQADMMLGMADVIAGQGDQELKLKYTPPDEQPAWTEARARCLSPGQFAAWKQAQDKGGDREDKETARFLDTQADRVREQHSAATLAKADEIATTLGLPKERMEKLDTLARSAVDQTVKAFRKSTARNLDSLSAEQRQNMIRQGNIYYGVQNDDVPTAQEVWKVGLRTLLSDADRQRLRELEEEHRARRARALGKILLTLMDEKTALTAAQRERLQGFAEKAVRQTQALFPEEENRMGYYQFQRETFFGAAGHIGEADARAVLDPVQWQHWQEACKAADGRDGLQRRRGNVPQPTAAPGSQKAVPMEPEEYERAISDCLDEKTAVERKRQLAVMNLKAEDAARVAGVDGDALARLHTAARGTVEEALAGWMSNLVQNVRSQVNNAGPENIRAVLANLPDYQFRQYGYPQQPEKPTVWDRTAATELTGEQRAIWQREIDARAAYKDKAIAAMVLAEFDRRYTISLAQEEKLTSMIAAALRDYAPDIGRMFAYNYDYVPWYLQTYTMFLPVAALKENDLKETLGKEAWTRWSGSQECANTANYWQNIQRYHEQRMKENKK